MTFDQLYAIAERQGTVQWGRDGVIEHLRLSKDKKVIRARPIKQSKVHTIRRHKDVVSFNCIEVDSITKVPIKPTIFDLKAVAVPKRFSDRDRSASRNRSWRKSRRCRGHGRLLRSGHLRRESWFRRRQQIFGCPAP